jgi:hypothetical protein
MLMGVHHAGGSLSPASKGSERETFLGDFLSQVFPPQYRFGGGDIIDQSGRRSGQIDIVVEYPFFPSLPIVGPMKPRLYLAEGVGAAIEVKSNIAAQWSEVASTAAQLAPLRRVGAPGGMKVGLPGTGHVPLFAVGYTGWKKLDAVEAHLRPGFVEGILVIDSMIFASTDEFLGARFDEDAGALWAFICCLHTAFRMSGITVSNVPIRCLENSPALVLPETSQLLPGFVVEATGAAAPFSWG